MKRNARPKSNQLITYYLPVCYLLRMQHYPVNTTYNKVMTVASWFNSYHDSVDGSNGASNENECND